MRRLIFTITGAGLIAFSAYIAWTLFGLSRAFEYADAWRLSGTYTFCGALGAIGIWCIRVSFRQRKWEGLVVGFLSTTLLIALVLFIVAPSLGIDVHFR